MTDRELLEIVAKAAGIEHGADRLDCGVSLSHPPRRLPKWNPLTDDGDALRLATSMRMDITYFESSVRASGLYSDFHESYGTDPYAATRRAIVRAAAAMLP